MYLALSPTDAEPDGESPHFHLELANEGALQLVVREGEVIVKTLSVRVEVHRIVLRLADRKGLADGRRYGTNFTGLIVGEKF